MQRPTGAPLPTLGPYPDQFRPQPVYHSTSHPSTSYVSPPSLPSTNHQAPEQYPRTHKRTHKDYMPAYTGSGTPPPKRARPGKPATAIDNARPAVVDDGSIYHLNALMTTKMMTEEMREQILDIIESGSRRLIPMCTVPRAAPEVREERNLDAANTKTLQATQLLIENIDGRHAIIRERVVTPPTHEYHQRSTSPFRTLQAKGSKTSYNPPTHHYSHSQAGRDSRECCHHSPVRSHSPQYQGSRASTSQSLVRQDCHQYGHRCCGDPHLDGFHEPRYNAGLTDHTNPHHHNTNTVNEPHPLRQPNGLRNDRPHSPPPTPITIRSPDLEACRAVSLVREESERAGQDRYTRSRDVDADLDMSTRTTRIENGDLDTSYGLDLGLELDQPESDRPRPRRYEPNDNDDEAEGEKDYTGDEAESENGTVAGKAPLPKTRNELANAIISHPCAQLLEGPLRCPSCRNAKRSVRECWVIAGKKGKCAPCTRSSQKCPFLLTLPGTTEESRSSPERMALSSNNSVLDMTQAVCDFAAHGKAITNLLSAWEPGNPAFEGFARKSLEAVAKDISEETRKLKEILKGM